MTSPAETSETALNKSVTVDASIAVAFAVFTTRFDTWWPRTHHIGEVDMAEAILEQRAGGRWYERGTDGSECEWGTVLAFDPPNHVALSWHLGPNFRYDPDPQHASRVDVWFAQDEAGGTRVDLVHSQLDRHGKEWTQLRDAVDSDGGWSSLLDAFAVVATPPQ